ncbi:hypothetical protein ACHHYP_01818 [Achlya hypogyna]|uniref:Uncharacterized protein n=1 Tax=Achlya hypogyna TaxID=1202772 RepID=A0A1V9Z7Y5_ACHHY|nr:hypothetical protein ACHHYP_01818 [Achlya hypogyna]
MCSSTISRPIVFVDDAHLRDGTTSSEGTDSNSDGDTTPKPKTIKDVALGSLFQHLKDIDLNDSDKAAFALDSFRLRLETLRTTKRRRRSTSSSPKVEAEPPVAPTVPMARVTLPVRVAEPSVRMPETSAPESAAPEPTATVSSDDDEKKRVHFADEVHPVAHVDMSKHHAKRHFAPFVPAAPYVRTARTKRSSHHQHHHATQQALHELQSSLKGMLFADNLVDPVAPAAHVPKPHVPQAYVPAAVPVVEVVEEETPVEEPVQELPKVAEPVKRPAAKVHIGGHRDVFDEETATAAPKIHCPSIHPHEYPEFNVWYLLFLAFLVVYVTMHQ